MRGYQLQLEAEVEYCYYSMNLKGRRSLFETPHDRSQVLRFSPEEHFEKPGIYA